MNTPPINPPSSAAGVSGSQENPPPTNAQKAAQNDLYSIQDIDEQIEEALARGDSPAKIQTLVNSLQPLLTDLQKLAPQLSPTEANLIDNAEKQYASFSQKEEAITPTSIALFQGTCDAVSQLIYCSYTPGGLNNINAEALVDQNQIAELANALQLQMQQHQGSDNQDCEDLLNAMKNPLNDLNQIKGELTSNQADLVYRVTQYYNDNLTKYETTTPDTVSVFQVRLSNLCESLGFGP
jgi:DNA repair exonuclease SbcCD ATPase subunit